MTLNELLDRWLARKKETLSCKAAENVARMVKRWRSVLGSVDPGALSPFMVEEVERLSAAGRSAAAVNQERMWFRQFVNWMVDMAFLERDVAKGWRWRKETRGRVTVALNREEMERVASCSEPWLARFVRFAWATGLREGTIRKLTWGMVDEGWTLRAPAEILKTKKPLTVPLGRDAAGALGQRHSGSVRLFEGLPSTTRVYCKFKAAVKKAGVNSGANVHSLRASFAMRLMERGTPMPIIMSLGGWTCMETVMRCYYVPVGMEGARRYLDEAD